MSFLRSPPPAREGGAARNKDLKAAGDTFARISTSTSGWINGPIKRASSLSPNAESGAVRVMYEGDARPLVETAKSIRAATKSTTIGAAFENKEDLVMSFVTLTHLAANPDQQNQKVPATAALAKAYSEFDIIGISKSGRKFRLVPVEHAGADPLWKFNACSLKLPSDLPIVLVTDEEAIARYEAKLIGAHQNRILDALPNAIPAPPAAGAAGAETGLVARGDPVTLGSMFEILKVFGSELKSCLSSGQSPALGAADIIPATESSQKGKLRILQLARLSPPMSAARTAATSLLGPNAFNADSAGRLLKDSLSKRGLHLPGLLCEKLSLLHFSASGPTSPAEIHKALHSAQGSSAPTLHQQLSALRTIVEATCGDDAPFSAHVRRSIENLDGLANKEKLSIEDFTKEAVGLLLDLVESHVSDLSYSPDRFAQEAPGGWFAKNCPHQAALKDKRLDAVAAAVAAGASSRTSDDHNGSDRGRTKKKNKGKEPGSARSAGKKRPRDDEVLGDVCGVFLIDGPNKCKNKSCSLKHSLPSNAKPEDIEDAKARVIERRARRNNK